VDQDETWHVGKSRTRPQCVRWGPSSPSPKGHSTPQFSAYICCGQIAGWIKMPLGTEVGFGPGDFVLDGDPARPTQKGGKAPFPIFDPCPLWPNGWIDQDGTWHGGWPWSSHIVLDGDPAPLFRKRGRSPLPNFRHISTVAERLDASKCHLVWR